jgi:hypothetical protein
MAVTNPTSEYTRLRSYLNPYIQGPNTDSVLNALAIASAYLVNNANAVNSSLYISTAQGTYLDQLLAAFGIARPPNIGLPDDIFAEVGIAVKNRKQVRDLINNILDLFFGDQFVRASSPSQAFEPYDLSGGGTLIVNYDANTTTTIIFSDSDFNDPSAATAQEVADAISAFLDSNNVNGGAIAQNNGNGNYVLLLSDTIGPASSVTVQGGSAENELLFNSPIPAGGNMSTQWTISFRPGGVLRYTWSGGANPNVGLVSSGNYVNIFGGGFASSPNEGSYTIIDAVGGAVGVAYFDILNPLGTTGIVVEGIDNAVLFFNPVKRTILSQNFYAAVYQTQGSALQIFLPASTQIIRRSRIGSSHVHYVPYGTFTLNENPNSGDTFSVTSTYNFVAGVNFVIGATAEETTANLVAVINAYVPGVAANADSSVQNILESNVVLIQNDSLSNTLTITYTGAASIVASGPQGDQVSLQPNQQGPYVYDTAQPFVVSSVNTTLTQSLNGASPKVVDVVDSSSFPNQIGYLIFDYGTENQEGPVPYLGTPSSNTLLISPSYTIQNEHAVGSSVFFVASKAAEVPSPVGLDYGFYITDVASGRAYAQSLIESIAATGINIVFTIKYPGDIGLGKWGTQYSEITQVYGP